jgi:hypothetical protein
MHLDNSENNEKKSALKHNCQEQIVEWTYFTLVAATVFCSLDVSLFVCVIAHESQL